MKIAAISDVHVKKPDDEAFHLLLSFFGHPQVKTADYVLFLGDIFDLMVGPHDSYLKLFHEIFSSMDELQKAGKKVLFFEGNHDVHLEKLFKKIWKHDEIVVRQEPLICDIDGMSYYFSHGDEHEIDNLSYQRYIRFIRSWPLKIVADYLMPLSILDFIGERASKLSRKKGSRKFDAEEVKWRFRQGVSQKTHGRFDFVLGGHSHVQDLYQLPKSKSCYINNGYALQTKTFVFIEEHRPQFIPLG